MIKNTISTMMGYRRLQIADVAKIAGLKHTTVSNLFYDKTKGIDFETLNKLCFVLEYTPNDLLKYITDEQN